MKKVKGPLLLLLSFVLMVVSACSADSSKPDGTGKDAKTPDGLYTIKVLTTPYSVGEGKALTRSDETAIGKVIKEKFNIVFDFVQYSGDYRDKLNLMLAAGDYPELLRVEKQDMVKKYITAGAAIQLDDYVQNSKNFKTSYKDQIPYWRVASNDGKLYKWEFNVPQDIQNVCECNDIGIRSDILKEAGYPQLLNSDDYVAFLKKAMQDHPTSNGKKTVGLTMAMAEAWGMNTVGQMWEKGQRSVSTQTPVLFDFKQNKFYGGRLDEPSTKESLQFFNKLYREGVLDPESFTDNLQKVQEKIGNGQALGVFYSTWILDAQNKKLEANGLKDLQYVRLPIQAPSQAAAKEKRYLRLESTRPFDSVIITKNAKDPKRIFELIDWISSDEGQLLLQSGIEGTHYKVVDGKRELTDEFIKGYTTDPLYLNKEGFNIFNLLGQKSIAYPKDGKPYSLLRDAEIQDRFTLTPSVKETYTKLGWANSKDWYMKNGVPLTTGVAGGLAVDPASPEGITEQKLTELIKKSMPRAIMAKSDQEFETVWQDIMAQYKALNPQKLVDAYNKLYSEEYEKYKKYQQQ